MYILYIYECSQMFSFKCCNIVFLPFSGGETASWDGMNIFWSQRREARFWGKHLPGADQ